jgi:hypothetical protein
VTLRMLTNLRLADFRLNTAQRRSTGQHLPSGLYTHETRSVEGRISVSQTVGRHVGYSTLMYRSLKISGKSKNKNELQLSL